MADFLDRVLVGLNKGVNTVSENSKVILEKVRLNTQIKDTEDKKAGFTHQLGILAYNMQTRGEISIEAFNAICNEITQCNNEIENLKIEVSNLDVTKTRPTDVQTSQQYQEHNVSEDEMVCSCGFINKAGAKFCAGCGSKLQEVE